MLILHNPSKRMQAVKYNEQDLPGAGRENTLEAFFSAFRKNIIGDQQFFESPFGRKKIIYADWTASGRCYGPIEKYIQDTIMPFVANTHTGTTVTGTLMSTAYEEAKAIIKEHVNAGRDEVLVFCGSGMTAAVHKLQRILGMRMPGRIMDYVKKESNTNDVAQNKTADAGLQIDEMLRPVVFITHMEHHSNHVSWLETIATVEIIKPDENGHTDLWYFRNLLERYRHRKNKIAAVTACSNVTGIETPYHEIAKLVHEYEGLCFVDFACSGPYININMHPPERGAQLDAVYFSPHKFLGGPGTPGVLFFNNKMYRNKVPDQPGGGTVVYSNPWKQHAYTPDIEQREDGGTPPFLQGIKAAMCIRLKEKMGVENMLEREDELMGLLFTRLAKIAQLVVLDANNKKRLGVISFIVNGAHHNLIVKLLNDRFGIQARGGCSCAGTYGHLLLRVSKARSYAILDAIRAGNLFCKPGWVRLSIHPTMTNAEIDFIICAVELTARHFRDWMGDYTYDPLSNEYLFKKAIAETGCKKWFAVANWGEG
jgi:selenocysteine lyase/cysteine desulfurase